MRVALYWAPAVQDPLWQLGCSWLGRDAETGAACAQPDVAGLPVLTASLPMLTAPLPVLTASLPVLTASLAELTASPRHYGFHATLRPPMRLATGWDELRAAAAAVARGVRPFALPGLKVAELGGFLALRETAPCPALHDLAARCVELTDAHRLPPSAGELARRRAGGLSEGQEAMLRRWGYPYVMQHWFFHMTLTRALAADELAAARAAAVAHFGTELAAPRLVDEICVFTQADGPFLIAERFRLG